MRVLCDGVGSFDHYAVIWLGTQSYGAFDTECDLKSKLFGHEIEPRLETTAVVDRVDAGRKVLFHRRRAAEEHANLCGET